MSKIIEILGRLLMFFTFFSLGISILNLFFGEYLKRGLYHFVLAGYTVFGTFLTPSTIKLLFILIFIFILLFIFKKIKKLFN